jgi:hypothetical protein
MSLDALRKRLAAAKAKAAEKKERLALTAELKKYASKGKKK